MSPTLENQHKQSSPEKEPTAVTHTAHTPQAATIEEITVTDFLNTKMAAFALYTVTDRGIPTITSGIKPGAQRLLVSMSHDKLGPSAEPVKSAKVVASATGSYHPHSQDAMYGALASTANQYARVNLVEGIGSFGLTPGDTPAASRYTEARLSPAGAAMVDDVARGAVPMRPTYDAKRMEPEYLPAAFPALLVAGAEGMAYGWRSYVPQHNPREVVSAAKVLLDKPDSDVNDLMEVLPGPDFGTGGVVVGSRDAIREYFDTGRGKIVVRGQAHAEKQELVVTALPPGVGAREFIFGSRGVRAAMESGQLKAVRDVNDVSDGAKGLCIRIRLSRGCDVGALLGELAAYTSFETTLGVSVVALDRDRRPRVWSLRDVLAEFLGLRDEVVARRARVEVERLDERLLRARAIEVLALNKEAVVELMLGAQDRAAAQRELASRFGLDDKQAELVAGLPLSRLTKADVLAARSDVADLEKRRRAQLRLVEDPAARREVVSGELDEVSRLFSDPVYDRRTSFDFEAVPASGVVSSVRREGGFGAGGWFFDADLAAVGPQGGVALSEDDRVWTVLSSGKVKVFGGAGLPVGKTMKPVVPDVSQVVSCGVVPACVPQEQFVLVVTAGVGTSRGARCLRVPLDEFPVQGVGSGGVVGVKIGEGDRVAAAAVVSGGDEVLLVSPVSGWKVIGVDDVPVRGRGGRGVGVFSLLSSDEVGVSRVVVSCGGFVDDSGVRVQARSRSKVPVRGVCPGVVPAE